MQGEGSYDLWAWRSVYHSGEEAARLVNGTARVYMICNEMWIGCTSASCLRVSLI